MQLVLPEEALPAKLILNPDVRMSDDDFYEFCMRNPDLSLERTEEGDILIVPPAGFESDYRDAGIITQLRVWAKRDARGISTGATAAFILQTGATLSPDAAWVSNERLAPFSKKQKRKFLPVCPNFVVEVKSPSDRLKAAKEKMERWLRGGVELGWLIDGDTQTVYIYRPGQSEPEIKKEAKTISGEGPVAGFQLDLTEIWEGL